MFYAEKKLISAAENVADKLGGDKTKTTLDLLQKLIQSKAEAVKKDKQLKKKTDQTKVEVEEKDEQLTKSTSSTKFDVNLMEFMYVDNYAFIVKKKSYVLYVMKNICVTY